MLQGNNESSKRIKRGGGGGKERLGRKGRDPTATNLLAVIFIEIVRPSFNLNSFPKFMMMELSNVGNNLGLLYTNLMFGLFRMLC